MRILFSVIIALFVFFPSAIAENNNADRIVAVVNDMIVTQSEVGEYINFAYVQLASRLQGKKLEDELLLLSQGALVRLIEDKLILQQAKAQNITVGDAFIEAGLKRIKSKFNSEKDFLSLLESQNISLSDIKKSLREQELMRLIVERKIKAKIYVTPAEITSFFNEHPDQFNKPQGREVGVFAFSDKKEARRALVRIGKTKKFNKSISDKGKYQPVQEIRKGTLPAEAESQLFRLKIGEISDLIEIEETFYIFKVIRNLPPQELSLFEVQDLIYTITYNQKFAEVFTSWLDKLKNEAYIVIK